MQKDLALFNEIAQELLADEVKNPVVRPIPIEELFDTLDLSLPEEATKDEDFIAALKGLVLNTPRTTTKHFFNQLFGGRNSRAMLGELLSALLNNSMYTYKVGGPMIGMEKLIINKLRDMVGYGEEAGGTLATGGSMTNFMAMLMGRDAFDKGIKGKGVSQTMTLYTSSESHYSIPKNATFMGVGRDNVRFVRTNERGEMLVEDLEAKIQEDITNGFIPFFVNATASTTVLGAFDPISEIGDICHKYKLWFHVDGAFGGSVLFTDKYRHLLKGVEKTDSFSINAHKMLGTPLACSVILAKDKKHLYHTFSNKASYLFQMHEEDFNPGKISLQCGRRNDALKFWTLWKSVGTNGLGRIVEHQFHLADMARDYIRNHPDYTLYSFDDSVCICFNYKGIPADELCNRLYDEAALMVGFGNFRGVQFIRLVTINYGNQTEDIIGFFETLEEFAEIHF